MSAVGFFPPEIKFKDRQVFFSKEGVTSIRKISSLIEGTRLYCNELTYNDIYQAVLREIKRWWNQELVPDEADFLGPLELLLRGMIASHGFFCRVEGISLDGIEEVAIGSKIVKKFNSKDVEGLVFSDEQLRDVVLSEYKDSIIMKGYHTGSTDAAQEEFYYTSELSLSLLRLYACVLYEWAILTTYVRLSR